MPIISGPAPKDVTAAVDSVFTRTGAVVAAANDYMLNQIGAATGDYSLNGHKITSLAVASASTDAASLANTLDQFGAPAANVALNGKKITGLANGAAATDALAVGQVLAANVIPVGDLVAGTAGQVLGGTGPSYALPPGFELNYTAITNTANVTDTAEATATALISPGAITFDGAAVLVEFFCSRINLPTAAAGNAVTVTLFEGATQITRLVTVQTPSITAQDADSAYGIYRFTPTAGSHTYKVCAFASSTTGTPALVAGSGGTNGNPPAFVRFVKV